MTDDYPRGPRPGTTHDTARMTLAAYATRAKPHINTYVRLLKTSGHALLTRAEWDERRDND